MKQRVLIVDDNPINVEVLEELLSDDYALATAPSGEAGLRTMKDFAPDLVLLDIMMPGIDGYETCRRIKSDPCGNLTQVVLVSGRASTQERLTGYAAGADGYIVKPFNHDELLATVRIQFRLRGALTELARMKATAEMQNMDLERRVSERTARIRETRNVTMFALAKLADSRDPETGEHLERIRGYCQILADHLSRQGPYGSEIDKQFEEDLYLASPLHDIGKVGIPDAILLKPGKLTADEFEIMKEHASIGAETLEAAAGHTHSGGFLTMAIEIARSHHERFNGSGYPQGLKGQDIPLAARIVALADVFDALTSTRVYKAAMDPGRARTIIEEEAGQHFDPIVVEAFRVRYDDSIEIWSASQVEGEAELVCANGERE